MKRIKLKAQKEKEYVGNCVENPFDDMATLVEIVENAEEISLKEFLEKCFVYSEILKYFENFSDNYEFFKNKNVYFYRDLDEDIEYFYV